MNTNNKSTTSKFDEISHSVNDPATLADVSQSLMTIASASVRIANALESITDESFHQAGALESGLNEIARSILSGAGKLSYDDNCQLHEDLLS